MITQKLLNKLLNFFIIIIVTVICFFIFVFAKPIENETINYVKPKLAEVKDSQPIIGKNLYLSTGQIEINLPSIKEQLEIYILEPRFDFKIKKLKFNVKLRNSNKIKKISEEDKLYLMARQDDNFDFSEEKTSLSMQIVKLDHENVKIILEADLKELNVERSSVFESFVLSAVDLSLDASLDDKHEFKILRFCKWWGIDNFLNIQNKESLQKDRLEIDSDILYVEERDILIFKDGKWVRACQEDNTLDYPIARIKNINTKSVVIEAWDLSGDNKYLFSISLNSPSPFFIKPDQFITSVRKRTNMHISCMLDKQRMVLKEKDMLIKKDNRWKLLKRDAVLDDIRNEELFYFEKIEERNSKKFLVGYFFNAMRTNFQKIEVPIVTFASQRRIKKR